jgi:CelD/BcsL family acetyltransferase involved in cellulose biosynthesis
VLEGAWRHLTATVRADVVQLRKVREDAAIAPLLAKIGARTTLRTEAPFLDLSSARSFADYEQRYSAKARKNRRRLMRRLEEQGPVAFENLSEGAQASACCRAALALKLAWLEARGILSPALSDPRSARFFAAVAGDSPRGAGVRVSVLRSSGSVAGVQVGFACKGRLAMHIIVYNLAWEKSGVGVLHLERAIAEAYAAGIEVIDLLAPNEAYKMDWADGVVGVEDLAVPLTLKGSAFVSLYLGLLRQRLKALAPYMPGLARKAVAGVCSR